MSSDFDAAAPVAPEEIREDGLSPFARGILDKQPIRGYELKGCLASDDRRAVFKADDKNMDRTVAVKVMHPWPGREGAVEEFFSLAGSIARLRCPGVARGLDAGRGDGDFFLAYEFLAGESLAARLARRQSGRLTEKEAVRLAAGIGGILSRLFDVGHPHGHVTPSNVVLGDGGKVGLTDIGFAWTLAWPDDGEAFAAAPDFLPPERIEGELNVDVRGDLYSLGAMLHLALVGEPVFRGENAVDTLRLHREAKPAPVHKTDPRLSELTSELIFWLLEKDRDNRPRTPRDFLRRLKAHPLFELREGDETDSGDVDGAGPEDGGDAMAEPSPDVGEETAFLNRE